MHYDGVLYRPPSESQSLLIQMTVGCSYNKCSFCAMYDETDFKLKPVETVLEDVQEGSSYRFRRVFLCDGDALIAPVPYLEKVLAGIKEHMPTIERVGIYGDPRSILKKSVEELARLKELGLGIIYHGLESGDETVLKRINKGVTVADSIAAGQRVKAAGIQYSAIVMLGIGGRDRSLEHARATAKVLNQIEPDFIGVLTTMVVEDTPLYDEAEKGTFLMPSRFGLVEELKTLVENLTLKRGLLTSKHASNYLTLRVVFPYEQHQAVKMLKDVLEKRDEELLKPEFMRGL
jgi:radical SAM superfamily enzyme YgiQ (UPF0313 family)